MHCTKTIVLCSLLWAVFINGPIRHAVMAGEEKCCPPSHVHHESNELSRKQLWLHPRYCCLGVRSMGREERRGEMGKTTERGELTLLQNGV